MSFETKKKHESWVLHVRGCYYWQTRMGREGWSMMYFREIKKENGRGQTESPNGISLHWEWAFHCFKWYFYQSIIVIVLFAHPIAQTPLYSRWCNLGRWTLPNLLETWHNINPHFFHHFIIYLIHVTVSV